jgi:hypothetical protein
MSDKHKSAEAEWYVQVTFWAVLSACLIGGAAVIIALVR